MVSAEKIAFRDNLDSGLGYGLWQLLIIRIQVGAKVFPVPLIKGNGGIKVKGILPVQQLLVANGNKLPVLKMLHRNLIQADSIHLLFHEPDFPLDGLIYVEQLLPLPAKLLGALLHDIHSPVGV